MEKLDLKNLRTIQRKNSFASIHSNENKFRKVNFQLDEGGTGISQEVIFKTAMQGCKQMNQIVLEIQQYGNNFIDLTKAALFSQCGIQEPGRFQVKVAPNVQKRHSNSVTWSKSEYKTLNRKGRNTQVQRGKTMTFNRLSSQVQSRNSLISSFNGRKELKSVHHRKNTYELCRFKQLRQNYNQNACQKKVRLKTKSTTSLKSEITFRDKQKECIPLQKNGQVQQYEDSFQENAYRLIKYDSPAQYQVSKTPSKAQEKRKTYKIQNVPAVKQSKKIVYESYDFNGDLIQSTNIPQKNKKPLEEIPQIDAYFPPEDSVRNLSHYHQRQQRHARTQKQLKLHQFDFENQESEFLANLQKLKLSKNVEFFLNEKQSQQNNETTKQSINEAQQCQQMHQSQNKKSSKERSFNGQNQVQETRVNEREELIEEFNRIKFVNSTSEVDQENSFPFGLSKYVKVKKFQQKQTKSKSYNFHTVKYFSQPYQDSEAQIASSLHIKSQTNKGSEKVRANKKLFKEVFKMSLMRIDPYNREDVLTVKLIKEKDKQNSGDLQQKLLKRHCARNSDTLLLKKGFCIKPTIFKRMNSHPNIEEGKNNSNEDENCNETKKQQNNEINQISQDIKRKNLKAKTLQQGMLHSKFIENCFRKSVGFPIQAVDKQNIQKLFKKQTRKILIKQSAQDFRRQSFV